MRILVAGSGGREHALAWALHRSGGNEIIVVPGNPGTAGFAENIQGDPLQVAMEKKVDLVVVGPEAPLVNGIATDLEKAGIPCFGPSAECARLEGSKWFAKEVMEAAGVKTASGGIFNSFQSAVDYMNDEPEKFVIKADGLAAGKGVFLPETVEEAEKALKGLFSQSGASVVLEERLSGPEISILAICNGTDAVLLPPSRDHKRVYNEDRGPNTGGMGAVCPPPGVPDGFLDLVKNTVILPVLGEMRNRGLSFRGVLYAGLMLTESGPSVLEFNVRFGDPETQAVLPMVEGDLAGLFLAAARGEELHSMEVTPGASACVILASGGYPGNYEKGFEITGLDTVDCMVFHAGTAEKEGRIVTSGGRVLGVTGSGETLEDALSIVYSNVAKIRFSGKHSRTDIGRTV